MTTRLHRVGGGFDSHSGPSADRGIFFRGISSNGRALALHARGRGLDTLILQGKYIQPHSSTISDKEMARISYPLFCRISLVVEHRTCNAEVVSSILTFGFRTVPGGIHSDSISDGSHYTNKLGILLYFLCSKI